MSSLVAEAADGDAADVLLWARASAGDADAFGELFDRHAAAVYNFCFRLTADWSAAEDLMSATFVQAWRRAGQVRLEDAVLPWVLAVARNLCLNHRRSLRRRVAGLSRVPVPGSAPDHADEVAGRLDDERAMRAVHRALAALRDDDRAVVDLVLLGGLPYAEAAAALGVPVGTVRSRLSRAKSRLKDAALAAQLDAAEPNGLVGHRRGEGQPPRTAEGTTP